MFAKKKTIFPPGTFIPTPQRIIVIIQLCLVFSLSLWLGGYPFMGEHFAIKSKLAPFSFVMGLPESPNKENAASNAVRFSSLSLEKQAKIKSDYHTLQKKTTRSFISKVEDSLEILLFDISPFALAWIFFSAVISIMILRKQEGARQAAWILPLIVLAYGIDNIQYGSVKLPSPDIALFPSEQLIVEKYLNEPLGSSISIQEEKLRKGWNRYLIQEWAHEIPSDDTAVFAKQVDQGNFAFNVARLEKQPSSFDELPFSGMRQKEPVFLLVLYLAWNLFFACMMWKGRSSE